MSFGLDKVMKRGRRAQVGGPLRLQIDIIVPW